MASTVGDRVELFAASLEHRAVTDAAASDAINDSRLVEAARRGDRSAFGRLYDRYARMVHGILLARVPLPDVDDLVQDVFLLALPRLHSLRDITRFGAWLAAIARNRANDYHRQHVEQVELSDEFSAEPGGGPSKSDAPQMEAAAILEVIRSLPEAYRETLLLRLVEGMTGPEIAARTGLTPGSVRVNLHRGMQQLREKLASREKAKM
ncbi:MAG TPA: sigma-70 family RNA polymerase sigma factor [Candidatus Angelobacter sp.]